MLDVLDGVTVGDQAGGRGEDQVGLGGKVAHLPL